MLILIAPDRAGPGAFIDGTPHGTWVRWPAKASATGLNRLLSLFSHADWNLPDTLQQFARSNGISLSKHFRALEQSGYLGSKEFGARPLFVLREGNLPSAEIVALDSHGPEIKVIGLQDTWPASAIVVAEVNAWDTVAQIARQAKGRVLVVEYPPLENNEWSKFYLRGSGWPLGIPQGDLQISGLLGAAEVGDLLLTPEVFRWADDTSGNWGGAGRWLKFNRYYSPLIASGSLALAIFFVGACVYLYSRQEKALFGGVGIRIITLIPASVQFAGTLARIAGREWFGHLLALSFVLLAVASIVVGAILARVWPRMNPLYVYAWSGFAACVVSTPIWSLYSESLGVRLEPYSAIATGAMMSYLAGIICLARGHFVGAWISRIVAAMAALSFLLSPWWEPNPLFLFLPLLFLLVAEGGFRPWLLPILAPLAFLDSRAMWHGFVWAPGDLFVRFEDREKMNLVRYPEFFLSPAFMFSAFLAGVFALFTDGYFFHQVRRVWRSDFRVRRLLQCSFVYASLGILQPALLFGALMLITGGLIALLSDRSWTI